MCLFIFSDRYEARFTYFIALCSWIDVWHNSIRLFVVRRGWSTRTFATDLCMYYAQTAHLVRDECTELSARGRHRFLGSYIVLDWRSRVADVKYYHYHGRIHWQKRVKQEVEVWSVEDFDHISRMEEFHFIFLQLRRQRYIFFFKKAFRINWVHSTLSSTTVYLYTHGKIGGND